MKKRGCGPQTAALLSLWAVKAVAGVVVWNGGGADGKWTTPGNWTGGALPLATDTVEFGSGFDSGNIILDASQTVAGMIINYNKSSGGLYLGGVPANALTLNGNIKRTGGVSHLVFTCPVILNDTLTITNEASGNTRFARPVTSGHDIIFQGNIGSALEFSDNNRATFSGDVYVYGLSKNNVISSYKDGGFGTGDIHMYGCTMLKFRGESQTVSNNIAIKGTRSIEWGSNTTDGFYDHVGDITTDEVVGTFFSIGGINTTVRLSGVNTGPANSRISLCGSIDDPVGKGKFIIANTAALSWGYNIIGNSSYDITVMLEDGVAITNYMTRLRDNVTGRVTLGNETAGATNLISTTMNIGNFDSNVKGDRTIWLTSASNSLVRFTGRFHEDNVGDVMNIVKEGPGAVSMSYASDYKGTTVISNGTLLANNATGSATSTNTVTVCEGGVLGGTGIVSGRVTVRQGGAVSPGDGAGCLTVADLVFEEGAAFVWDATAAAQDLLSVSGDLTLPSALTVTVNNASGENLPTAGVVIMSCAGTLSGTTDGWTVASPNTVRLSDSGQQVLLCGPPQGTMISVR
jgi:autotransporter-associated beta strand protein